MKPLEKTLALLALVVLTAQTVRHAYLLWFDPRGSALDKYDRPLKNEIASTASLDDLVRRYDQVKKQVNEANANRAKSGEVQLTYAQQLDAEPYKSERELREAITAWEGKMREIRGLRFYWFVGLALSIAGLAIYKKMNRWYGLALIITAFAEIIYWTSPTFLGPSTPEFDQLLANKLVFSAISLVLLVAMIRFQKIFAAEREQPAVPERQQAASAT